VRAIEIPTDEPAETGFTTAGIGNVVNRGLSELYKVRPKNPVTFLANWLLNESRSKQIKSEVIII
jgi:hypothetical protein